MWEVYLRAEDTRKLHRLLRSSLGRGFPGYKGVLHELHERVKKVKRKRVAIELNPQQLETLKKMSKEVGTKVKYLSIDVENITDEIIIDAVWKSKPAELAQRKEEYERMGLESDLEPKEIRIYTNNKSWVYWKLKVEKIDIEVAKKIYEEREKNMMKGKGLEEGD